MNEQQHSHELSALFRTEERIRLLRAVLSRQTCTVHQIAIKTGLSKGLVSAYLALLDQNGLLSREGRMFICRHSALAVAIIRLLNVERLVSVI